MAENQRDTGVGPVLVGVGIAAGIGAIILIVRALRPPVVAVAQGVEAVKSGLTSAAEQVADFFFGVGTATEIVERTNEIVAEATAQIAQTVDPLLNARLQLVRLEAAKAEALALGQPFGLQSSINIVLTRIALLEAGAS